MVHMAAEHIAHIGVAACGVEAEACNAFIFYIAPTLGCISAGVHKKHLVHTLGQGQCL